MRIITGLFDSYEHASQAMHALRDAGFASADLSIIANTTHLDIAEEDDVGDGATTGAELGAVLGGGAGLLTGLGLLALPGLGAVLAGGWLFATALGATAGAGIGAATGGLIGALTHTGVPEADAEVYAEGVRRGGTLVTVRANPGRAETAIAILRHANGVDLVDRRKVYEAEGWTGFDEEAPEPTPDEVRDWRNRAPYVPPIV